METVRGDLLRSLNRRKSYIQKVSTWALKYHQAVHIPHVVLIRSEQDPNCTEYRTFLVTVISVDVYPSLITTVGSRYIDPHYEFYKLFTVPSP